VIAPALEHLGKEPFGAATRAGDRRVEEDQARLLPGGTGRDAYDLPPVAGDAWEVTISYPRDRSVQSRFAQDRLRKPVTTRNLGLGHPSNLAE
jgi:hypothetical protein